MILGRIFEQPTPLPPWDQAPVRGELFGVDRLEEHARSLAAAQTVTKSRARDPRLAARLSENAAFLLHSNNILMKLSESGQHPTPAGEWLIDNYHLVDLQIREIDIDLRPGFYAQLPKLAVGPFAGLPSVFGAMWSLVTHTDSHVGLDTLHRYLVAYQSVQPLTIGELWAAPITLRIVLIENLRHVAKMAVNNARSRQAADDLVERLKMPAVTPHTYLLICRTTHLAA